MLIVIWGVEINVDEMITHRLPFERIDEAFDLMHQGDADEFLKDQLKNICFKNLVILLIMNLISVFKRDMIIVTSLFLLLLKIICIFMRNS
ncbi:MAG: hypothetical protein ACI9E5_000232 [Candidatus Omnitrophota bacterium]|jgi:hypothetical protein